MESLSVNLIHDAEGRTYGLRACRRLIGRSLLTRVNYTVVNRGFRFSMEDLNCDGC